ncbi:MAG: ribonuclease HII [Phascolarctobacterium sp.]|nr:ribonuclease HII [Phascolarctobacterium sp.]
MKLTPEQEKERYLAMTEYEEKYYAKGNELIAGVDEAGRGPLAGPLVIGGVILPRDAFIPGLNDSKKLTEKKREALYEEILKVAVAVSVNIVSVSNIDTMNIYNATRAGMAEVLKHLTPKPQVALVDAMEPFVEGVETVPIIKGDALSVSIAAASVIAKVTRDRIMVRLDALYPEYGFAGHKGYGSAKHMAIVKEKGACIWHRRSFEPVKSMALPPVEKKDNILYSPLLDKEFEYNIN